MSSTSSLTYTVEEGVILNCSAIFKEKKTVKECVIVKWGAFDLNRDIIHKGGTITEERENIEGGDITYTIYRITTVNNLTHIYLWYG